MSSSLVEAQRDIAKFNEGLFEITKILKDNFCCNDPNFQKALTQKIAETGNEKLSCIVDVIVTEL